MKGIEFLKKIGRIEDEMISEAANPVKKSRKWNGNMIKFAGLAACIAVFVGAICVGSAGIYLKKGTGPANSADVGSREEELGGTSNISQGEEKQEENTASAEFIISQGYTGGEKPEANTVPQKEAVSKRMVMIEGKIYVDAGESDIEGRCGMMDGSIDSFVESGKYPEKDNQSNFGSGYGYQYVGEGSIDVNIDGQWIRFETSDSKMQEEPFGQDDTKPLAAKEPSTELNTAEPVETTSIAEPDTVDKVPVKTVGPGKIEVSLNTKTITAQGAEFLIINTGYENATTGTDFCIEKLVNGNWLECDYIGEGPIWKEIALVLEPEKEMVFYADWSRIYGSLDKGTYRFRKSVYGDDQGQEIYCEFTL